MEPLPCTQVLEVPSGSDTFAMRVWEPEGLVLKDGTRLGFKDVVGQWERNTDVEGKIYDKKGIVYFGDWVPVSLFCKGRECLEQCVISHQGPGSYAKFRWLQAKCCPDKCSGQWAYHRQLAMDVLQCPLPATRHVHHCRAGDIQTEGPKENNHLRNLVVVNKDWHDSFHGRIGGRSNKGKAKRQRGSASR